MSKPQSTESMDFNDLDILVVDDQEDVRRGLQRLIGSLGCNVRIAESGETALSMLRETAFDIVFTDIKMGGMSGVDLMERITENWGDTEVVLITGYGTIELAVQCLRNGASHFITKPFDNQEILDFVERAGYRQLARKRRKRSQEHYQSEKIIARSPEMHKVLEMTEQVAPKTVPVLVEGESGTGKELIAHAIHEKSSVSEKPFLAINCAALPDSLLESELFGYKQGAFTGAHEDTRGLFEQAQGGTIFLDEIASMSMAFQGKLLRVLENKVIRPLGGGEDVSVDFRLITATNRNLEEMVEAGEFREDLLYRIDVFRIELPTLNERKECIPALTEHFIERFSVEILGKKTLVPELTPASLRYLREQQWSGNVRELENTIKRALVVCDGKKILPSHLGLSIETSDDLEPYEDCKQQVIEDFQRQYINKALIQTDGNVSQASEMCGLTRAAFQRIMKKLDIEREVAVS
ncbi:MAG: sigma-54 dependent transcriptional regulator [Candidatus Marinimicrobia bacterium]|nr:sigma-54 dependent transcriptional regulator [Candidatus Neomarinimicrobiota bacterium]MCF7829311.1 sigma-54 dependent transcriptional regulator [Candidatus Neomarinimicrobiota bacterium]MCF7880027.1 sigma-54 dependent transcriptional regulator [Candidatus Neomarinimicrobiota bacterium]